MCSFYSGCKLWPFSFVWFTSGWHQHRPGPGSGPRPGSGSGLLKAPPLVCILGSFPLSSLIPSSCRVCGGLSIKSLHVDWSPSNLFFFLPSRQLVQVSVLHQFLQIFFTLGQSSWCTWVINTVLLVAETHVILVQQPCDQAVWAAWKQQKTEDVHARKTNGVAWRHHGHRWGESEGNPSEVEKSQISCRPHTDMKVWCWVQLLCDDNQQLVDVSEPH